MTTPTPIETPAVPTPPRKRRPRTSTIVLASVLAVTTLTLGGVALSLTQSLGTAQDALTTAEGDLATAESDLSQAEQALGRAESAASICQDVAVELRDQLSVMVNDVVIPLTEGAKLASLNQFVTGTVKIRSANDALDGLTERIGDVTSDYQTCTG